jgi:NADH:ubiquinone oxidoreductase subunit 5 (subunit L)/multisubunit Na+/H+ antiporter MnhA subunit
MMLIVTGVGGLIIEYSLGYMGAGREAPVLRVHVALRLRC